MYRLNAPIFMWLVCLLPLFSHAQVNLQCEHLVNPLGIDALYPRFSWQFQTGSKNAIQYYYSLLVSTDSVHWIKDKWKATGHNKQLVTYAGKPLRPFTRYYWKVRVTEQGGGKRGSAICSFETGPLTSSNWKGDWITDDHDKDYVPAPYFRKTFMVTRQIVAARANVAAGGIFELSINGEKAGDYALDPALTRYDRRNLYVTFDVTKQLQEGKNAIGILLGNGWYNFQPVTNWGFDQAPWRERPCFCMDLRITYSDGSTETIASDESWKTSGGALRANSVYTGENYNAGKAISGWDKPDFKDKNWDRAQVTHAPSEHIVAQAMYPIRDNDTLNAISVHKFNDSDYVFDIGRNIAGVSQISLTGQPGTVIRLKHAERLNKKEHADQSNLEYWLPNKSDLFQTDVDSLKGDGSMETFKPRFNYKGFRYVEVTSNQPITLAKESLKAFFRHSAVPPAGTIQCSNKLINKLWKAANASYLSNLQGYPTDCPQREKNGWTGDAHFAVETGLYNFDAITIYEKWLADNRDAQQPNGTLPAIIPTSDWGYDHHNAVDWVSGIAIIPWELYRFYGDSKALKDNYSALGRYIDRLNQKYSDGIAREALGDREAIKSHADPLLTSTAYYYADVNILAKAAKLFGIASDYSKYSLLAAKIKTAFNKQFYHNGNYGNGCQTENSSALYWGLVPEQCKEIVAKNLAESVLSGDSVVLDIGVLGSKTLLNALSENGYAELAYRLATKHSYPSWGYWMDQGLTTLAESWDLHKKISWNHIFLGEISAWFYKGLGGILPDENDPGFHHILLRPHIPYGLDSFKATHDGPYGIIVSGWTTENGKITYTASIPPNSTANLQLEVHGKIIKILTLKPGTYHYQISQTMEERVNSLLSQMTQQEKLDYIGGYDYLNIRPIPRLGLPEIRLSDGPIGIDKFGKSTAYPAGILAAATWDTILMNRFGQGLAKDAKARGVNILLGPGVNIYRAPMCGRNFEYFGEDPYLTSRMAVNYIKGVQSQGVAATVKHFVANNAELDRKNVSNNMNERTLQEIYLPAFKAAVTEAKVSCVMDSYNLLNGVHLTQNKHLNLDILKNGWDFKGVLMSDWHSTYDGIAAANAGLDLEMPAGDRMNMQTLLPAIASGQVSQATIDDKVRRILTLIFSYGWCDKKNQDTKIAKDNPENAKLALDIARSGMVLLKNNQNILPLIYVKSVAVIGPNADQYIAGGGSSEVTPFHSQTILQGIEKIAGANVNIIHAQTPEETRVADVVIVCLGFNKDLEQENMDRPFELPPGQDSLVNAIAKINRHVIVLIEAGGNVRMQSWINKVPGLIYAGYPGQEGGRAIAEVLFGKVNPSGKLSVTFEKEWKNNPAYGHYYTGGPDKQVTYAEGIFVGYRGYEKNGVQPQFPFGYGLSYTTFAYSNIQTEVKGTHVKVTFAIKNTGNTDGAEVAELYVHQQHCNTERPYKELKGFDKVFLKRGETKRVSISLDQSAFSYYKTSKKVFGYDPGNFDLLVGSSSQDIHLKKSVRVGHL